MLYKESYSMIQIHKLTVACVESKKFARIAIVES